MAAGHQLFRCVPYATVKLQPFERESSILSANTHPKVNDQDTMSSIVRKSKCLALRYKLKYIHEQRSQEDSSKTMLSPKRLGTGLGGCLGVRGRCVEVVPFIVRRDWDGGPVRPWDKGAVPAYCGGQRGRKRRRCRWGKRGALDSSGRRWPTARYGSGAWGSQGYSDGCPSNPLFSKHCSFAVICAMNL